MRRTALSFILAGIVCSEAAAQAPQPILSAPTPSSITTIEGEPQLLDDSSAAESDETITMSKDDLKSFIDEYLDEKKKAEEAALTPEQKKAKAMQMEAKWNNGLELSTKDKNFRTHIGGRYQFDTAWFDAPQNVNNTINVPYGDGVDFRRARLRMDGTLYEVHEYAIEFDFVNSVRVRNQPGTAGFFDETVTAPTDLWWNIKKVPLVGNVKIGNQKEQIGFEHIVSSRFQPFMERSFNQDAFYGGLYNGFQPGVTIYNSYGNEKGLWSMGLFKPTNNVFSSASGDGDYAVNARLTNLLWYEDDGRQLLHIGISARQASAVSQAGVPGRLQTFRTRDAIRSGLSAGWPVPAGITLFGDDMQWANAELVSVMGPFTWQSEYLVSGLQDARLALNDPGQTVTYHGGYAQVGYFLTGENDNYDKGKGSFDRVTPYSNFFKPNRCGGICGCGAWQAMFRYNYLDLNDQGLNGGLLSGYTTGLNWFWNPNMKMQFNYNVTNRNVTDVVGRETGGGNIYGYGSRIAMDF